MDPSWASPERPLSIKEISDEANKYVFNAKIPLKHWLRAADTLLRQGLTYEREGNLAQAYLLLLRHSTLVLDHLPTHPDARTPQGKKALKPLRVRVNNVLGRLDELKPQINEAHEEWLRISASQRDASTQLPGEKRPYEQMAARDAALSWNPRARAKLLDAGENQELAVDLAKKEFQRRDAARKATRQAGISEEEEQARRGAGLWDNWDSVPVNGGDDSEEIRHQMDAARQRLDQNSRADQSSSPDESISRARIHSAFRDRPVSYQYPSISRSTPLQHETRGVGDLPRQTLPKPPSRPPKESLSLSSLGSEAPPALPDKQPLPPLYSISPTSKGPPKSPSESLRDPSPKPMERTRKERYTFRPAAYLEDGTAIRPLFLPANLRNAFLKLAAPNTRRGLEMCGILCGTIVNNALFISCLLIPEQTCTSDTCETDNEAAVMEYCTKEDLMVFGWIHTHPTQTCFMSSRDLHTQAGYQVMMPESIAIVCAPRSDPDMGIFRLTNPPGLGHVLDCQQTATFHMHNVDNLYTDAAHPPGHVYETRSLDFHVEDLRPKK